MTERATKAESKPDGEPAPPMIIAEALDFGTGPQRVFHGLDFELPAGSLGVVVGPAGSGKSILLAALVGRFGGLGGRLRVAGLDAIGPSRRQSRQLRTITTAARIGTFVDLEPKHSLIDAINERAAIEGLPRQRAVAAYDDLAPALELDLDRGRLIDALAGYQRTALTVLLAMLRPSSVLVLDDAHRGLNAADQDQLLPRLVNLAATTATTIVVSSVEPTTIPHDAVRITLPAPSR